MQNKSAVLIFTIALALATVYMLSFNLVSRNYESVAAQHGAFVADTLLTSGAITEAQFDSVAGAAARAFLRDSANAVIYPVFGHTYKKVKENELNLGLDLQGGMSVTLEVSMPDLLLSLSDYSENTNFRAAIDAAKEAQRSDNRDYVSLFADAWKAQGTNVELWRIFHNMENKDLFPAKITDDEVIDILREEARLALDNTESIIRKRIDQFGVAQPNVQKLAFSGRILVELPGISDRERVRKQLKSTANLEFWETLNNEEVFERIGNANEQLAATVSPELFARAKAIAEAAADTLGVDSLATDSLSTDSTLAAVDSTLANADSLTLAERRLINPIFSLLQPQLQQRSPIVGYALVGDTAALNAVFSNPIARTALGPNLRLMWEAKPEANAAALYAISDESGKGKAKIGGRNIIDAGVGYDEIGDVIVNMTMDSEGSSAWARMTELAAADGQRPVAVVLDNKVYSAPSVRVAITNGRSQISFGSGQSAERKFTEAADLAGLLKAGSLPAPARIVDEVSIGPELGEENIQSGIFSFILAILVVMIYMIFYYKGAGVVSDIALVANIFFLIGALASLGAALTLPGIAGIVLTIGMAVDANVLIYERIREEMRQGKGLKMALEDGYSKAYSSIIDANLTTLLTAIVLYTFGSGAIRGFATTLIIGIFTSLFSAIVITRLIFFNLMEKKKSISFETRMTKSWFTNMSIDFIGKRKLAYIGSGILIVLGIVMMTTRGLDLGIDFTGGATFDVKFESAVDVQKVRDYCADAFTEDGSKGNPRVQTKEDDAQIRIMTNYMQGSDDPNVDEVINGALTGALDKLDIDYEIERYNKVDSTISDDFRRGAQNATLFSLLVIFLYLVFRFRRWQFGVGALIALIHDVLIVLSIFAIFWGILPFTMEIDQAFIAAILTVIGYSINDTVVVFDRIRENLGLYGAKSEERTVINSSLNSTLSRTVNTSLTTFVVLLIIFIFGGDNIKGFVFALMTGVVVGTYSSLFVATPIAYDLRSQAKKD